MKLVSKLTWLAAMCSVVVLAVVAIPNHAFAANGNPAYCDSSVPRLDNQNIGTEVPVVMVHGLFGNATAWGSISDTSSFAGRVNNIPGVAVAHRFDYNWSNWVTDPQNGPRLAKTIDCVAQISQHNGGKGKVIVVGYSMGGLMARDALSRTVGQHSVADEVGQVVTIGTPHAGANVSAWCGVAMVPMCKWFVPGSPELTALPPFPPQTIVHTSAGDVTRVYYNQQGQEINRENPYDDTLVPVNSANEAYTIDANKGGGSTTVTCQKNYLTFGILGSISYSTANCEHGQLIQDASNGIREDTIAAIEKYVAYLNKPAAKVLTVGNLTTSYDSRWINADYGASGPGQDLSADDTTNAASCTNCTTTPPPMVNAFIQVINMSWCTTSIDSCAVGSQQVVDTAPAVTIGGKTPSYSARYLDSGYTGTSLVWCVESEHICVYYRRATDTPQLEPSQALLDVLNTATWGTTGP